MDATADKQTTTRQAEHRGRVEDDALVRGLGRYIADAPLPNQAYAFFVRSPHAFARIASVDSSAAANAPGVIAVLTAQDMEGVGNIARHPPVPGRGGAKLVLSHRPPLATRSSPVRRSFGQTRPAISPSIGRALPPIPTPMRRRASASSLRRNMWRASP